MRKFSFLSLLPKVCNSSYRQWLIYTIPLGILAIVFSFAVATYLYTSHLKQQKELLHLIAEKTVATFDHEMLQRAYSVMAMRRTAEQYLSGRTLLTFDPTHFLHRADQASGYTMKRPPGYSVSDIGNITGAGPVPAKNSLTAQEIAMTVALLPLFKTIVNRDIDTPWVYYTSQNRFTHIFPWASPSQFFYSDKSLEYDVFKMALPKNNPQRKIFWTPPYLDEAGKGMMVTVASPVYQHDSFRGTIAIDITLSKLDLLLRIFETSDIHVFLYTLQGDFLAGTSGALSFRPADTSAENVIEQSGYYVTGTGLQSVPWRILVASPKKNIIHKALWYSLPFVLVTVLLFGCVILVIALISSLRVAQECSIHDALTGLYNRRHFDLIAGKELAGAQRDGYYFGLIMIDIDHFKQYNDTFGHQAGDELLKWLSQILIKTLKRPTDSAFRIGGEEFSILTKADHPEQIETLVQLLLSTVADETENTKNALRKVTLSAGVTIVSSLTPISLDALYAKTDKSLYRAKEQGRNQSVSIRI